MTIDLEHLVADRSATAGAAGLVGIAFTSNPRKVDEYQKLLEEAGVSTLIETQLSDTPGVPASVTIAVPSELWDEALEILNARRKGEEEESEEEEFEDEEFEDDDEADDDEEDLDDYDEEDFDEFDEDEDEDAYYDEDEDEDL